VTTSEQRRALVARDEEGRVFMTESNNPTSDLCGLPDVGSLPVCDEWMVVIFDPKSARLWHWGTGERDEKTQYVEFDLNIDQVKEVEQITSPPPVQVIQENKPGVGMEDLGERSFEGILARGSRTITFHSDTPAKPSVTIHEVWTSVDMGLILEVVDGDPGGTETISGLDHISFSPAPVLFKLPTERILRHARPALFEGARHDLDDWLVR
jgi:hypothetical protein